MLVKRQNVSVVCYHASIMLMLPNTSRCFLQVLDNDLASTQLTTWLRAWQGQQACKQVSQQIIAADSQSTELSASDDEWLYAVITLPHSMRVTSA